MKGLTPEVEPKGIKMRKKQNKNLTLKDVEKSLSQQTVVILDAVDKKLERVTKEFKREINTLRISIDKFVGFYTKQEQEFTIMKEHLKRLEARVVSLETKLT